MASSKKPALSELQQHLQQHIQSRLAPDLVPGRHLAVGLSGGVDSVALLHLLRALQATHHFQLSAIHINHQLSLHAPAWEAFCSELCAKWRVPFACQRVKVPRRSTQGLEGAAREQRYRVFAECEADAILLAHHQDDQAETILLNLLRGSGVRGAAAMRASRLHGMKSGPLILRPLLEIPRAILIAYAKTYRLQWIEDDSNLDLSYARNFLRHEVFPKIAQRFPAYRQNFARAAQRFAEAEVMLNELAAQDLATASQAGKLKLEHLRALSRPRARMVLRTYLQAQGLPGLSADRMEQALQQLLQARGDRCVRLEIGPWVMQRYRGEAWLELDQPLPSSDWQQVWNGEPTLALPELGGRWIATPAEGAGLSQARLGGQRLSLRLRQGGEKIQPDCARPRRSLKKLLQETAIPPWQRARLPLLFCEETLVAVPGIGIDCAYQAQSHEPGLQVRWEAGYTE